MTATRLTDEVIDGLHGRELDEAVCIALGWRWFVPYGPVVGNRKRGLFANVTQAEKYIHEPIPAIGDEPIFVDMRRDGPFYLVPHYSSELLGAMGLLFDVTQQSCHSVLTHVYESGGKVFFAIYESVLALHENTPLATGPKDQSATVICRAFLKLKNRGE